MTGRPVANRLILACSLAIALVLHALIFALPASQNVHESLPQAGMLVSYAPRSAGIPGSDSQPAVQTGRRTSVTTTRSDRDTGSGTSNTSTVTGTSSRAASQATIRAAFLQKIESMKTYPSLARASGIQGNVRLRVILNEQGNLASLTVLQPSGNYMLDEAAEKLVRSVLPFQHHTPSFTCEFSITYRLSDAR